MLYTVTILLCSLSLQPRDCDVATAIDVTVLADPRGAASCGMQGQATMAQTVLPRPGTYIKIRCRPVERPAGDVG